MSKCPMSQDGNRDCDAKVCNGGFWNQTEWKVSYR